MGLGEEAGKLTQILPAPLFTLWHAISSYIGAWDAKAAIHVVGDEAEAMRVNASASEGREGWGGTGLRPYPLNLDLSLRAGEVVFSFIYYAQLRMLTVAAKPDPASKALSSLFPGDDGAKLPDQRCLLRALSLKPAGGVGVEGDCLHSILPARPYMWAQWMGGLGPVLNRGGG
ncbi:MAG: hypothetical protein SGPRY_014433, partial [Prymnesium sp.]